MGRNEHAFRSGAGLAPAPSAPRRSTCIAEHPDRFTVAGLAAGGRDLALLGRQIREHGVRRVAVADPDAAATLRRSLPGMGLRGVEVLVRAGRGRPS